MAIDEQDPPATGKPWGDVLFTSGAKPYAFRADELLVSHEGQLAIGAFFGITPIAVDSESVPGLIKVQLPRLPQGLNVVRLAALLRAQGFKAQPNHVFFADMFVANPGGWNANPGGWNANPGGWNANPGGWNANPGGWNANAGFGGHGAGCCCDDGGSYVTSSMTHRAPTRTYAHPADEPTSPITDMAFLAPCTVVVLDTGLALTKYRDQFVGDVSPLRATDVDDADESGDGYIDPAAGHGTFIAGIIERLAPKAKVELVRVLKTSGDGDDFAITKALNELATRPNPPQIVSMSLSGYTEDDKPPVGISGAIARLQAKGIVVVASAGNDATCRPAWPAALPDVVSVAAMGPYGPAPFTNHGPWVRACAPGLEVVSRYFKNAEKGRATPLPGDSDLDDFDGWATWSGTSFAAPYVAGVLAREIMIRNLHPEDAVARVIDEPSLLRLPGLGTVVNG